VAVNPSDTKMRGAFVTPGGVLGTDYAGTVVACGPEVTEVEVGDRVCGAQHTMNANTPHRGSFGEYNISAGKVWLKLPASVSTEGGATFGAGISTASARCSSSEACIHSCARRQYSDRNHCYTAAEAVREHHPKVGIAKLVLTSLAQT
jgi:NADPH:quinone reductase-like Zn-dependent oxidoreductase